MMQRRFLKADLNDGFSATVSPRALASLFPIVASIAHDGIKPQRIFRRFLLASQSAVMGTYPRRGRDVPRGREVQITGQVEVFG
jgi:hypothetical protein